MRGFKLISWLALAVLAGGLSPVWASGNEAGTPSAPLSKNKAAANEYILGTGDKIRMTVYQEDDLSGEYEIGSTGSVALPLIGSVHATGLTVHQFEEAVAAKLSEGYIKNPRVNAQVMNYRPFFILGEISKPGSYPYVNGMTVLNAVALAGGYTYRADEGDVVIKRADDPQQAEMPAKEDTAVKPGDIIRVPERFF